LRDIKLVLGDLFKRLQQPACEPLLDCVLCITRRSLLSLREQQLLIPEHYLPKTIEACAIKCDLIHFDGPGSQPGGRDQIALLLGTAEQRSAADGPAVSNHCDFWSRSIVETDCDRDQTGGGKDQRGDPLAIPSDKITAGKFNPLYVLARETAAILLQTLEQDVGLAVAYSTLPSNRDMTTKGAPVRGNQAAGTMAATRPLLKLEYPASYTARFRI
jgi:hypothetical protein